MKIAGFQKMSALDFPGKLAAILFTQGCNFACDYCHNPELLLCNRPCNRLPENQLETVLEFLSRRKGLLDGVVITGGEPTLQDDLLDVIKQIKAMGFLVKLDTNGSNPALLKQAFKENLLDFVAMDLKLPLQRYALFAPRMAHSRLLETIRLMMQSGVDYEFRSTILPAFHSKEDLLEMGSLIQGAKHWALQNFRSEKTLSKALANEASFTLSELQELGKLLEPFVQRLSLRS